MGHRYNWGHASIPKFEDIVQPVLENLAPIASGRAISEGVIRGESATIRDDRRAREYQEWSERLSVTSLSTSLDPLAIWLGYIRWTDVEYPCDVKRAQKAMQKCLALYEDDPAFQNDERYVKLWLRWITLSSDRHRCFRLMAEKGIGSHSASFYIQYAGFIEQSGLFLEVDAIFAKGVAMSAMPFAELKYHQTVWQKRFAAKKSKLSERLKEVEETGLALDNSDRVEFGDLLPENRSERRVLTVLKSRGSRVALQERQKVGSNSPAKPHSERAVERLEIFSDASRPAGSMSADEEENPVQVVRPVVGRSILEIDAGIFGRDGRENRLTPTSWAGVKIRQALPRRPAGGEGLVVFNDSAASSTAPADQPPSSTPTSTSSSSTSASTSFSSASASTSSSSASTSSTSSSASSSSATVTVLVPGLEQRLINEAGEEQCIEEYRRQSRQRVK